MRYVTLSQLEAIQQALAKKSKNTEVKTVFPPLSGEKISEVIVEFKARTEFKETRNIQSKIT